MVYPEVHISFGRQLQRLQYFVQLWRHHQQQPYHEQLLRRKYFVQLRWHHQQQSYYEQFLRRSSQGARKAIPECVWHVCVVLDLTPGKARPTRRVSSGILAPGEGLASQTVENAKEMEIASPDGSNGGRLGTDSDLLDTGISRDSRKKNLRRRSARA